MMPSTLAHRAFTFTSALLLAGLLACSTTTNVVGTGRGDGGALPEISADELGADCAGFGTSIGYTALFKTDTCPGGACLVDARGGLDEYCSAECDSARCPAGYLCQAVTLDGQHACFRDPDAPPDAGAADAGPASFLDVRLPGYKKGSAAKSTIALSDYADPTGTSRDLVIVLVDATWSVYDRTQLTDFDAKAVPRAAVLSVLSEGAAPGDAATASDLASWHTKYPNVDAALDPELASLGTSLGTLTAFPTWFVFNARTMEQIATEAGYMDADALDTAVAKWRTLAK